MSYNKVAFGFEKMTDAEVEMWGKKIVSSLINNKKFKTAPDVIDELHPALILFSVARQAAHENKSTLNISRKTATRNDLIFLLNITGMYVNADARSNIQLLHESGYPLPADRKAAIITRPAAISVKMGHTSGQIIIKVGSAKGINKFIYETCTEEPTLNTFWLRNPSGKKKLSVNNLIPGKKYWIRVGVKDKDGKMLYSEVISTYVV